VSLRHCRLAWLTVAVSDFGLPDTPESTPQAQIDYTEKLEIDYRHFDAKNIEPR
jgi:hypothetical protein